MLYLNGKIVNFGRFPNGESNLNFNKLALHEKSVVTLRFESDLDLMNLFVLKKYMDSVFPSYFGSGNKFGLRILYMPYSRMDRRNDVYVFSLLYVTQFINSMQFAWVEVFDAHSDVTAALLNGYVDRTSIPTLFSVFRDEHTMDNTYVFYPDAGAEKRYCKTFGYPTLVGSKERDFESGHIKKYDVHGEFKAGSNVVIVDDLSSKGGTFMMAAAKLKEMGANNIYLIVGHCEETATVEGGVAHSDLITHIYTTNSIFPAERVTSPKITAISLV